MKKILKIFLISLTAFFLISFSFLFLGKSPEVKPEWGVNFSQKQAESLDLDWKETYLALINDLGAKKIKIASYWDLLEPEKNEYNFEDLDWELKEAEKNNVEILLVMGMKTPRWPECHIPPWAKNLSKEVQQERILKLLEKVVLRYENSPVISAWQVENEPFFPFGECPWQDEVFLKREIELVKSLDSKKRPVVVTESGEFPFWFKVAEFGDVVGVTMYRKVWFHQFKFYFPYPFPPVFYSRKAQIIKTLFRKEVIGVELQAEPWGPQLLCDSPLFEQEKSLDLVQMKKNIEFAGKSGLREHYLWGSEWWYWMKKEQGRPEFWQEARKLFIN